MFLFVCESVFQFLSDDTFGALIRFSRNLEHTSRCALKQLLVHRFRVRSHHTKILFLLVQGTDRWDCAHLLEIYCASIFDACASSIVNKRTIVTSSCDWFTCQMHQTSGPNCGAMLYVGNWHQIAELTHPFQSGRNIDSPGFYSYDFRPHRKPQLIRKRLEVFDRPRS